MARGQQLGEGTGFDYRSRRCIRGSRETLGTFLFQQPPLVAQHSPPNPSPSLPATPSSPSPLLPRPALKITHGRARQAQQVQIINTQQQILFYIIRSPLPTTPLKTLPFPLFCNPAPEQMRPAKMLFGFWSVDDFAGRQRERGRGPGMVKGGIIIYAYPRQESQKDLCIDLFIPTSENLATPTPIPAPSLPSQFQRVSYSPCALPQIGLDILPRYLKQMSNKIVKTINERFAEQGGHEQAIELDLSNLELSSISKEVKKTLDKAKGIEVLVISENKLTSLQGLPDWKLSSLNASTNKLNDAAIPRIAKFTELSELILAANDIKKLESLAPLFALKNLEEIDLSDNPVSELPNYRETLFEKIATLKVIDGLDREGKEVEEQFDDVDEDDEGEDGESDEDFEDDEEEEDDESESKDKKKK